MEQSKTRSAETQEPANSVAERDPVRRRLQIPWLLTVALLLVMSVRDAGAVEGTAPAIEIGETPGQVIEKLGKPQGRFKAGKWMTFCYEQGMVDFCDERVARTTLVSPEELKAKRQAEAEAQRAAEQERARLAEAGRMELNQALSDPLLRAKTPKERIEFWTAFSKSHPYTNISNQLAEATASLIVDGRRQDREVTAASVGNRLAEIQARLVQLDADYAASLTHWKRNEIEAEQTRLRAERDALMAASPVVTGSLPEVP
jgi:hypothetical protein